MCVCAFRRRAFTEAVWQTPEKPALDLVRHRRRRTKTEFARTNNNKDFFTANVSSVDGSVCVCKFVIRVFLN